ncbi:endosomal transmembrane epsin interactor 1 isoform X2 [Caloenas nicobarica]|uniref:endosomal transmembrane epsin interactor 1 isoform X2 n=1 Tax=Caloenas nicobarica TaxID=187106 RepID=UPI0032B84F4C
MSLPVLLPGISCPVPGLAPACPSAGASAGSLSTAAADPSLPPLRFGGCSPGVPQYRNPRPTAPAPGAGLLPRRPLLPLGLLQVVLGCSLVALNFRALSLSSGPQVKNTYSFWAGSSVILSGILGLMSWKKPVMVLANLFVLLSIICVLLNVAGLVLGCQGIQFVSSILGCDVVEKGEDKICICCEKSEPTKCPDEESALKLYHVKPCNAARLLLKKVLFALCALNALTTTVCLAAAALRYLKIFLTRRSCIDESQVGDQDHVSDPDDFVPPVPPPSYFSTFCSCTPQSSHRMLGSGVIPLPHIYGARIKGIEVFCPLDPPPPYEAVCSQKSIEQESALQASGVEVVELGQVSGREAFQGPALNREAATQTELKPQLCTVTLRNSSRARALRGRPQSLIDYRCYTDTKQLVSWILEQSCSTSPDIHELVENIKSLLKSDEKHMAEAITSATFLEQVMAPAQQATSLSARVSPCGRHPRLPHVQSCCDLSVFTTDEEPLAETRIQRAEHERPHSIIGVVRETVL